MSGGMQVQAGGAGGANPHLNVFEPYAELARGHEDQLTRAAMIVLRLVPLAREALLRAIGEPPLSRLPECAVDLQSTHLVDPAEEHAARGRVARGRLVSVFLTPDIEPQAISQEIVETDRGQRFDGVLRFDPELVVLIESKVCRRWARRNGHRVAELNLGGVRFDEARTCVLRWHDLLEDWWRLTEIGVLSPAEQAIVTDMLGYIHQDFGQLLPFGSLRRVGADPVRRRWRLRSLLRAATGIEPERGGFVHVRLDTALGTLSLQRVALDFDAHDHLTLHAWPAELKPQAARLYREGHHSERLCALAAQAGWRVEPQPILGFRNAPRRTRVYLTCDLDAPTYAQRWREEDWSYVGAHAPQAVRPELWPWLLARGYASEEDAERLDPFLRVLGRRYAHLRPSMHVTRSWSWRQAERLEEEGRLAEEIRAALSAILDALDEPALPAPPRRVEPSPTELSQANGRARADRAQTGRAGTDDRAQTGQSRGRRRRTSRRSGARGGDALRSGDEKKANDRSGAGDSALRLGGEAGDGPQEQAMQAVVVG